MKQIIVLFAFVFLLINPAHLQDCNGFYPMKEGVKMSVRSYDKKAKATTLVEYTVSDVSNKDGGIEAQISAKIYQLDKKGKKKGDPVDGSHYVICKGDKIYIDMSSFISQLNSMEGLDLDISGTDVVYPADMQVNDKLPDSELSVKASVQGVQTINWNIRMIKRKVEAIEDITTEAGTFTCYKISGVTTMDMGMMGQTANKTVTWIAKGIGTVRSETYDANGALSGYSELVSIEGV